ncbi:hypothetical protein J4226_05180 [Candidatus Pacearchaeota archaeon]|nr:hypothetical protein [Candidatus Pacearchaeota archaeon]
MAKKEINQPTIEELTPQKPSQQTPKPTPEIIPTPQTPIESTKRLKPKYKYISEETISQIIKKSIPKQFIATKRFAVILGLIFLVIIALALIQFPFNKLLSGETNIIIGIGYPWPFLELGIMNPEDPPLRPKNLFLDLIIYLLISYLIDIAINFILDTKLIKSKEELKEKPKIMETAKPTLADKITKKIFDE